MRESKFQSKCPECGNIDILSEWETKKKIHCQRCYRHYDYKEMLNFDFSSITEVEYSGLNYSPEKKFIFSPFNLTEIQYIRSLIMADKIVNEYELLGMKVKIDQQTSMHNFTDKILTVLDELEEGKVQK
ncbi:hypothetical protein KDN24_06835 [Bacillus sp. Bva_UNVM-123]|uniref:hypothetical protein n=1 Tax=Bacillus sp. Bva_UNVM-123 TaxID=2829798 RepID=UPI00391F7C86